MTTLQSVYNINRYTRTENQSTQTGAKQTAEFENTLRMTSRSVPNYAELSRFNIEVQDILIILTHIRIKYVQFS